MVPAEYFAILSKVLETVCASTINQMGKNECHCTNPEASRRCLVDSSGTACKATCKIQGYEEGICSPQKECKCSGKSKWGHTIDAIEDFGQDAGQAISDFFG